MRGFLRQRGDAWELRVYVGRDAVTGRERYRTKTVHGGKREAQRQLNQMIAETDKGTVARTTSSVGELLDAWLDLARRDFSPKTVKETAGFIERTIKPGIGHVPLSKLGAADLDRFYTRLQTDSGRGSHDGLAPSTIRRVHGIVRRALQQGVRWGWLGSNVAAAATPPRVPVGAIQPPTAEQLARVLLAAEADDPDLATFLWLSGTTGARRSELVALRWRDVDLDGTVLTIERGIVMGPDGLVEKDTKTHAGRRVALDAATTKNLSAHHERARARADACQVPLSSDCFVFTSTVDGSVPRYPDSVSRAFRRVCRSAGIDGVRLHDLRHYVATSLLVAGVDVRTVAGRLGHRNAATTLNVYAHFLDTSDRNAADILAGVLATATSGLDPTQRARP